MRSLFLKILDTIGFNALFRWLNRRKFRIVMYHGVSNRDQTIPRWTVITEKQLEEQLAHIAAHYHCMSASEFVTVLNSRAAAGVGNTFITLDDGLKNNMVVAEPVLKKHGLPACCFVCPELSARGELIWADYVWESIVNTHTHILDLTAVGGKKMALPEFPAERAASAETLISEMKAIPDKQRRIFLEHMKKQGFQVGDADTEFALMSIDDIRAMSERGTISVASHTTTHPILSRQTTEQQRSEIAECANALERAQIMSVPLFAYPNGKEQDFTDDTLHMVKESGFVAAFTTVEDLFDHSADKYKIPRIAVGSETTLWEFKAQMSGLYFMLMKVKKLFRTKS